MARVVVSARLARAASTFQFTGVAEAGALCKGVHDVSFPTLDTVWARVFSFLFFGGICRLHLGRLVLLFLFGESFDQLFSQTPPKDRLPLPFFPDAQNYASCVFDSFF